MVEKKQKEKKVTATKLHIATMVKAVLRKKFTTMTAVKLPAAPSPMLTTIPVH